MTKFVKIVCIGFCFGICNLRSETYNVITVSRTLNNYQSYGRLEEEEIYLVFAQLARCFSEVDISELPQPRRGWSTQARNLLGSSVPPKVDLRNPTIIVFNETFFGKNEPLLATEVENIISIYKKLLPGSLDIYLYINFLYKDIYSKELRHHIVTKVKPRYEEVAKTRELPQFCFSKEIPESYVEKCKKGPDIWQTLLFNQTKIFHGSTLIGYYNKSSYFEECSTTLSENLYYVLGNFETHYLPDCRFRPPVDCLTCYDIAVLPDKMCPENPMFRNPICAFSSNSTNALSYTLAENPIFKNPIFNNKFFVCVDPLGYKGISANIDCAICLAEELAKRSVSPWLCGVFRYSNRMGQILTPMPMPCDAFSFSYKIAIVPPRPPASSGPLIRVIMPSPPENMFTFKFFTLTTK